MKEMMMTDSRMMMTRMEQYNKYEQARIVGARAMQIAQGAPVLIKFSEEELKKIRYSTVEIAKLEFAQGLIPITVKRPMPTTHRKVEAPKPFDQTKLE